VTLMYTHPMTGKLLGIATKPASRAPMVLLDEVAISLEQGLAGDWRGASAGRQVTVLFARDWETLCRISGSRAPWERRRANLLIGGMDNPRAAGGCLTIAGVTLEITGETHPCNRMNQGFPGLKMLLAPDWRGGLTCVVVAGGPVRIDDPVTYHPGPGR